MRPGFAAHTVPRLIDDQPIVPCLSIKHHTHGDLPEARRTLHLPGSFTRPPQRRQQQRNEEGQDAHDDQKFYEGKPPQLLEGVWGEGF